MRFVLDASVAIKWLLPEVDSAAAVRLRTALVNQTHEFGLRPESRIAP